MKKYENPIVIEPFKRCTMCPTVWQTRDDFLSDPDVTLVGYQAHFEELKAGLVLFNHACKTTMALDVEELCDLYEGPIFKQRATGSPNCLGYCLRRDEVRPCPAQCAVNRVSPSLTHSFSVPRNSLSLYTL